MSSVFPEENWDAILPLFIKSQPEHSITAYLKGRKVYLNAVTIKECENKE